MSPRRRSGAARQTPSSRVVTMRQVADHCGLSIATVSMALRADPRITAPTRAKVEKAAAKLGYDPRLGVVARRLGRSRSRVAVRNQVCGVVAPGSVLTAPYFRRLLTGILAAAETHHCGLLLCTDLGGSLDVSAPPAGLVPLVRGEIDALLMLAAPQIIPSLEQMRQHAGLRHCPTVSLMHAIEGCSSVCADERAGAAAALKHLEGLGHRRFLLVGYGGGQEDPRRAGYRAACGRAELFEYTCPPSWMDPVCANQRLAAATSNAADKSLVTHLRSNPGITAVLAENDAVALHVIGALRRAKIDVPGQVSVVGFDDTDPLPGLNGKNLLSSVALPLEEIGRAAFELAWQHRDDPSHSEHQLRRSQFIPRQSTGRAC